MTYRTDTIVFPLSLLQDVNILRGLAYLAARETSARIVFLMSDGFVKRDWLGTWQAEVQQMATDLSAEVRLFGSPIEALAVLQGRRGLIIAGSESDLNNHRDIHGLFRIAPPGWLTVTLQHGLECVGFLQNREHVIAHGRNVGFGADIVCTWSDDPRMLTAMNAAQASKAIATGPSSLLQRPAEGDAHGGIVAENLHSARLNATGAHAASFMEIFSDFCTHEGTAGRGVTLRPHPGGQYVLKNAVPLADNVTINNDPMYRVPLAGHSYGISAPSTVVLDMVLAGVPTAVWRDPGGVMDVGNYTGLAEIDTLETWVAFVEKVRTQPDEIRARQSAYLDRLGLITDRATIYARYARLLINGLSRSAV